MVKLNKIISATLATTASALNIRTHDMSDVDTSTLDCGKLVDGALFMDNVTDKEHFLNCAGFLSDTAGIEKLLVPADSAAVLDEDTVYLVYRDDENTSNEKRDPDALALTLYYDNNCGTYEADVTLSYRNCVTDNSKSFQSVKLNSRRGYEIDLRSYGYDRSGNWEWRARSDGACHNLKGGTNKICWG